MSMKKFNINNFMKAKLTDRGKDIYYHRWDELNKFYGKEVIKPEYPEVDENGFTEFQLWDFMSIYGKYMFNGMKQVIKYNNIYIDEKYTVCSRLKNWPMNVLAILRKSLSLSIIVKLFTYVLMSLGLSKRFGLVAECCGPFSFFA